MSEEYSRKITAKENYCKRHSLCCPKVTNTRFQLSRITEINNCFINKLSKMNKLLTNVLKRFMVITKLYRCDSKQLSREQSIHRRCNVAALKFIVVCYTTTLDLNK